MASGKMRMEKNMKKIFLSLFCVTLIFSIANVLFADTKSFSKKKVKTPVVAVKTSAETVVKVTFVELGSVNCVPCKMMQPIIKEVEEEYKGQVNVVFYDVWKQENASYAEKYKIRVIPTQVFLDENGKEYFRHEGFFPKDELIKVLKEKGVK